MLRAICAIVLVPVGAMWAVISGAGTSSCPMTISYEYYDVDGDSIESLKRSMMAAGPKDEYGKPRFAYTGWNVRWHWPLSRSGRPQVAHTTLTCTAKITVPRLHGDNVDPEVRARFDSFMERVMAHELKHVSHVENGAPAILTELRRAAVGGMITADRANKIAHGILSEIRQADREYDKATSHGKTEGAWDL